MQKTTAGEAGNPTAGREGGAGPISKLRNNKRRSLGPEWPMFEVVISPLCSSNKPHGLVASINNTRYQNESIYISFVKVG